MGRFLLPVAPPVLRLYTHMFNWNLDELFPHNIDVWMRNPSFYEAGKPKTDTPT